MRSKILLFFLGFFLIPNLVFAGYYWPGCMGCSKYRLCTDKVPWCNPRVLPGWWLSGEYLLLWRKKRFYPPLVTTNVLGGDPILGEPGTEILFGGQSYRKSPKSGMRGDAGFWVTPCIGVGGGGWGVKDEKINFFVEGFNGVPPLGRPIFDILAGVEDDFAISEADDTSGSVDISAANSICGGDVYARYRFLSSRVFKFDFLGGFMMHRISDNLDINSVTTLPPILQVAIHDHFNARNTFYAGLLGLMAEARSKNWALFFTGKLGLGNMVKRVTIDGQTALSVPLAGTTDFFTGGLLALPSNMGRHGQNGFALGSQISAQLQLRIWDHLWFTIGYTHMYWQKIALAGDQIDLDVNISQLFGNIPFGPPAPLFEFNNKNFYIHGATAGFYIVY